MADTGSIYIIRNTFDDKFYIGQTKKDWTKKLKQHYYAAQQQERNGWHLSKFYDALLKNGLNKFYTELLEDDISLKDLDDKEVFYIYKYSAVSKGYNTNQGGRCCWWEIHGDKINQWLERGE